MSESIIKIENILKSEYSTEGFVSLVTEIFDSMRIVAPNKKNKEYSNFNSHIETYSHIGSYTSPDNKKIAVFEVQLKAASYVENSRSTQRSYARKLIENGNVDGAIIAFFTPGDSRWRLSFVRLDYEMKFEGGKFKTQENLTPAKRYSFLVGKDEPCHTAISRFRDFIIDENYNPTLDDIEEAFSVEKVTKEFFSLYCEKFYQLQEYLETNQDFKDESERCGFTSEQFAKKLMGQIVFLYFLQKKGWLGVKVWSPTLTEKEYKNVFYTSGAQGRIIKDHLPKIYTLKEDGLYHLNSRVLDDIPDEDEEVIANNMPRIKTWGDGSKNFLRTIYNYSQTHKKHFYEEYLEPLFYDALNRNRGAMGYCPALHCRVPFLSGGLFDPIDNYDWKNNYFDIPDEIFSNKKSENDREANGILDIFDRYNFTMSEDEPMEREVAIDPEMLGKVFENLLEVKDRKSKGAFYTPREIVHYMCQESLINYLVRKTGLKETDIRDFILYGDFMKDEDTSKEKREGNGGMFISEEIFDIDAGGKIVVNRLTEIDNALANVKVADPAVGSGAFPLGMMNEIVRARQNITAYMSIGMNAYNKRMLYQNERSPYVLKYNTIKNCLYAVDIEPSAVDIAQLRLWLSLVIDDEINPLAQNDLEGHRDPLPLPNLECNILCGNSLIDEFRGKKLIKASDIIGSKVTQIDAWHNDFEIIINKLLEEQDLLFRCDDPIKKQKHKEMIQSYKDMIIFVEGQNNPDYIEEYNKAKSMSSKPFIVWELDFARVFRDNGGFDIVIGNPPYIGESGHKEIFRPVADTEFGNKYYQGKMDFFYFFFHKGLDILRENGICGLITTNYYLNASGAKTLRSDFRNRGNIIRLVNFNELKIFQSALGQHNIITFIKKENQGSVNCCITERKGFGDEKTIRSIVSWKDKSTIYFALSKDSLYDSNGNIVFHGEDAILQKMKRIQNYYFTKNEIGSGIDILQECVVEKHLLVNPQLIVGKGIFAIESEEIIDLHLNDYETRILRPYYTSEQIRKYSIVGENHKWILYTDKDVCENIDDYPNVRTHLDKYKDIITSDNAPYGLHRARKLEQFVGAKILSLRMTKEPYFTYADKDTFVTRAYLTIKPKKNINLKYLVGICNSHLFYYWLFNNGKRKGKQLQIDQEQILELPIFIPNITVQESMAGLIDDVSLRQNENNDYSDIEEAINKLVYKIYSLSEEEIEVVENFIKCQKNSN